MRYLKPIGRLININDCDYRLIYTLDVIDELQDKTDMTMPKLIECLTSNDIALKKAAISCLLKYLIGLPLEPEDNELDYYSLVLLNTFIDQMQVKKIETTHKKKIEIDEEEDPRINIEYYLYLGTTVLGYPEDEVWKMTIGKLMTLMNEHALFNGWMKEDKEVSIDDAIPL